MALQAVRTADAKSRGVVEGAAIHLATVGGVSGGGKRNKSGGSKRADHKRSCVSCRERPQGIHEAGKRRSV